MVEKVQRSGLFRRARPFAIAAVVPLAVARFGTLEGRVTLLTAGQRSAADVGEAVVWLERPGARTPAPVRAEIGTQDKKFFPHVLVVPVGSTVAFPNHDPFNHNVFSLSEGNAFDLGLYGRGETRTVTFERPGLVQVYCNVHAQMSAFVVVRDNPWYTQPSSDGSFRVPDVPPGDYTLRAWHERAPEVARPVRVGEGGLRGVELELDARGYRFRPHLNKFGRPYASQGRRY